jgi:hypothetical protein
MTVSESLVFEGLPGGLWSVAQMQWVGFIWRVSSTKDLNSPQKGTEIDTWKLYPQRWSHARQTLQMVVGYVCFVAASRSFEVGGPKDSFNVVHSFKSHMEWS